MDVRQLDLADLDAAFDIRARSFGPVPETAQSQWKRLAETDIAQIFGVYDGARLVGCARYHRFTQWWCGRAVPMAGVAGVVVSPEDRGRGVGQLLMTEALARVAEAGFPLSALYPQTVPLYRRLGWEIAGVYNRVTIPGEALRTIPAEPVKLRRVGAEDTPEIMETIRRVHVANRDSGPIEFPEHVVRFWMEKDEPFAYLAEDGYLEYSWQGHDTLDVESVFATSERTSRALWGLVGSGASVTRTVRAVIAPHDPVRWFTQEAVVQPDNPRVWMLRVVDAAAAIAARGFPPGVTVEAVVAVDDRERPGNRGPWRLHIAAGVGTLVPEPAAADPLTLTAGGFAALYAGSPLSALRVAGLASGGDVAADALLDAAFAANAYLLDYF